MTLGDRLADSVPTVVALAIVVGMVVWLASRIVRVLDRYLNGWQDIPGDKARLIDAADRYLSGDAPADPPKTPEEPEP